MQHTDDLSPKNQKRSLFTLILCSWRQLTGDIGHDAVNPKVSVIQHGVHQVDSQLALPRPTLDLRHLLYALYLGYQCPLLHVVSEHQAGLLWPLVLRHTCNTNGDESDYVTKLVNTCNSLDMSKRAIAWIKWRYCTFVQCWGIHTVRWKRNRNVTLNHKPVKNNPPASCAMTAWKGSCRNSSSRGLRKVLRTSSSLP